MQFRHRLPPIDTWLVLGLVGISECQVFWQEVPCSHQLVAWRYFAVSVAYVLLPGGGTPEKRVSTWSWFPVALLPHWNFILPLRGR